ncbi:MAG: ATP-binding protein [Bacteroidia bacterium]|nr:ATP-binding protein [Bacteroidia bacterium]
MKLNLLDTEMIHRLLTDELIQALQNMPVVVLLGPRQVGKTTLAFKILETYINKSVFYLDLELDTDLAKLEDAEGYLRTFENKLLIIDEVQLKPDLFRILRGLVDIRKRAGESHAQFLLLGSASKDLLQQSSETLAGRIRYLELKPFLALEIEALDPLAFSPEKLWFRGGFPQSYLAPDNEESWKWRSDFIASYLERDIPQLGLNVSATQMRRFWTMLSHLHGQQINMSSLGKSLEVSHTTVRNYLDILTDLYMIRQLQPWSGNTKKRLVKSPKIYIRDTGLLHRLLSISEYDDLMGHPILGHSWEGFVIENILGNLPDTWQASYYRTADQTEIDLILEKGKKETWAIEVKRTVAPKTQPGFHRACVDVNATQKFVLYSGRERFPLSNETEAIGLVEFLKLLAG